MYKDEEKKDTPSENEELNFQTNSKADKKIEKKKIKAEKRNNPQYVKKHKRITNIIVSCFAICLGGLSGYIIYVWKHPKSTQVNYYLGREGDIPTEKEMNELINSNSILDTNKNQFAVYQMINYSLYKHIKSPYTLTIGKANVLASGITQKVESATFSTPECIFNQNISSSSIVSTANKFYDNKDGNVTSYLGTKPTDWQDNTAEKVTYSYDDYIQTFGKLLKGEYYVATQTDTSKITETKPVPEIYISDNEEDYKVSTYQDKYRINGVLIYIISSSTQKNSNIIKTDSGYHMEIELWTDGELENNNDSSLRASNYYYACQMKKTGGLKARPVFSSTKLEINVDNYFNLVSSTFYDTYTAVVGPINSNATQKLTQYYFRSDNNSFNGVEVDIPKPTDTEFNGYQLFPNE